MSKNNLNRLRNQINRSFVINQPLLNKPNRTFKKGSKPQVLKKSNRTLKPRKFQVNPEKNYVIWDYLYTFLTILLVILLGYALYTLFVSRETQPETVNAKIIKTPKGDTIIKQPAGSDPEDKYSSLNAEDDFEKRPDSYPDTYGSADDGITKVYYINTMSQERKKLNDKIRKQNLYIEQVNNRVRQINDERMYTPTYLNDQAVLSELREYERKLANKVVLEAKNQPYLPDQANMYI